MVPHRYNTKTFHTLKKLEIYVIAKIEVDHDPHAFYVDFGENITVVVVNNSANAYIYKNYGYSVVEIEPVTTSGISAIGGTGLKL